MELLKIYDKAILNKAKKEIKSKGKTDWKKINTLLEDHVSKVLPTLNKKKLPLADLKGHELTFFTYWNKFVKGQKIKDHEFTAIVSTFSRNLSNTAIMFSSKVPILEAMKLEFRTLGEYCRKSGKPISCHLNDKLEFEFTEFKSKKIKGPNGEAYYGGNSIPLTKNTFKDSVQEKIINVTSGNLIFHDYFRCNNNEFRDAIEPEEKDYSEENSINYPRGRVMSISRSAELNFIEVNMVDSPSVYQEGNKLIFGEDTTYDWEGGQKEKDHNKNFKGKIYVDRWTACAIDEQIFIELLLNKGHSQKKAEQLLKQVKKDSVSFCLKVKPGKYKLSFCGDFESFDKKMRKKGCKVNKKYKMYCLLEKV